VNIGDSYIVITIGEEQNPNDPPKTKQNESSQNQTIHLKIFSGQNAFDQLYFKF
jgi:hypothetical protein